MITDGAQGISWAPSRSSSHDDCCPPRLRHLHDTGFEQIGMHISQLTVTSGKLKRLNAIALANISEALIAQRRATPNEINRWISELGALAADDRTATSVSRVVQVWASTPT